MIRFALLWTLWGSCAAAGMAAQTAPAKIHAPAVILKMTAAKKTVTVDSAGKAAIVWQPVGDAQTTILPGDVIRYTITGKNRSAHAITQLALTQPIPHGMEYLGSSATAISGATLQASIDGGATYAEKPQIEVTGADGAVRYAAAPAARYTHLRWVLTDAMPAESTVSVSCEVRVR